MELSRFRGVALSLLVAFMVLINPLRSHTTMAQNSPGTGHSQVIAQGVDLLPTEEVAWRVTESTAKPGDEAEFFDRTLGFVVATSDPFLVSGSNGENTLLHPGQASFHPEGASERRSSLNDDDATYRNIELIVASGVDDEDTLGSSDLVFGGDAFEAPRGTYNLQLTREVMDPGADSTFEVTNAHPYVLIVTEGALQVTSEDGEVTELEAGDIAEFSDNLALLSGNDDGATWIVAAIGDEVEIPAVATDEPAADTGEVVFTMYACPDGTDVTEETDDCEPVDEPWIGWLAPLGADNPDDFLNLDADGKTLGDGQFAFRNLEPGTWEFYADPDHYDDLPVRIEGDAKAKDDDSGIWTVKVRAGKTSEVSLYTVLPEAKIGALSVSLWECPAGTDPITDASNCAPSEDAWDLLVTLDGQASRVEWTLADAELVAPGTWEFSEMPASMLTVSMPVPGEGEAIEAIGDISPASVDDDARLWWMTEVPTGSMAEITFFHVAAGSDEPEPTETPEPDEPAASGSLVIEQYDCPYGTDISVDTSPCTLSTEPWDVVATNIETGDAWSILGDGYAYDSGTYVLEGLPTGTYTISVYSNENWDVWGVESVEVSDANESYLTIYSVDRRVP